MNIAFSKDPDLIVADTAIKNAKWRKTTYIAYHEYVMEETNPTLLQALLPLIEERGYNAEFGSRTYRYWNHDGYRYWIVDDYKGIPSGNAAINRTHEDAERI